MIKPTLKIDERFKKRVQSRYERFDIQGGVLVDKPHHEPRPAKKSKKKNSKRVQAKKTKAAPSNGKIKKQTAKSQAKKANAVRASNKSRGLGTLEGGPVRLKKASTQSTNAKISERIRKDLGIDYLRIPFTRINSVPMKALRKAFGELLTGKNRNYSAVEAKFRAVLRTPIIKKQYGRNTPEAAKRKTFNRFLIDTGQFYKAIVAKLKSRKK